MWLTGNGELMGVQILAHGQITDAVYRPNGTTPRSWM